MRKLGDPCGARQGGWVRPSHAGPREPRGRVRPLLGFAVPRRVVLSLACAASLLATGSAGHAVAKNPLDTVEAQSADEKSPGIKTESASEGGVTLAAIHDGDFAAYRNYDFDSGVAAFKARVAGLRQGSIEIRLDGTTGKLLGTCRVPDTGGWNVWQDVSCPVNNSESGARDVFLVFRGGNGGAVTNLKSFVFLKTTVLPTESQVNLWGRLDPPDDGEPQGVHAWGMPEGGFTDDFTGGKPSHWVGALVRTAVAVPGSPGGAVELDGCGDAPAFAYTPDVYVNKTDMGGEWRTLAEGALSADLVIRTKEARPGIGFVPGTASRPSTLHSIPSTIPWTFGVGLPMAPQRSSAIIRSCPPTTCPTPTGRAPERPSPARPTASNWIGRRIPTR